MEWGASIQPAHPIVMRVALVKISAFHDECDHARKSTLKYYIDACSCLIEWRIYSTCPSLLSRV